MNQSEFNKEQLFQNLIKQAKEKELGVSFVLSEFKRNKWNLNLKQATSIANELDVNIDTILYQALDLNILNVESKIKKALLKNKV
jgi:hypothetical protein